MQLGEQESKIFESHLMLLIDVEFLRKIKSHISQELINTEHAVELEVSRLEYQMRQAKSRHLKERSHDIRDIGYQIQKKLISGGIRQREMTPMVAQGLLCPKFQEEPNRPDRAYTTNERKTEL